MNRLDPKERSALLAALGMADGPAPDLFMIARAGLALLDAVVRQLPVVILVDDLQWIDQPSQKCLAYLARRLERESDLPARHHTAAGLGRAAKRLGRSCTASS